MNFIFIPILIVAVIRFTNGAEKVCTITEQQAEACGSGILIIGNDNFSIPQNEADVTSRCKDIEDGIECLKNYGKNCLDKFSSRVMGMVSRNGKKMADKLCNTAQARMELLTNLKCWKDKEAMAPIHLCMDKYMVQMESVGDVSNDDRIPAVCCSSHMLKECLKTSGTKTCDKPEAVTYIDTIASGVTGDLMKFICGKFATLDDCDTKMDPTAWQKLKDLVASDDPQQIKSLKKFATPFGALKDIMKKIRN